MIIQCRKCETRFRFDENMMEEDGAWVRCGRCQHVFFQERPLGDLSAAELEAPSVRISDVGRMPNGRFPTEVKVEIPLHSQEGVEKRPPLAFGDGPSFEGLEKELDKEYFGGSDAGLEKEEAADGGAEAAAQGKTGRKRWGRTILKVIALVIFLAIVAGSVWLYLFPEDRTRMLMWASPWLRGVPVLENLIGTEMQSGETVPVPVRVRVVRQRSVSNLFTGNLGVIEGVAVNQASYPIARIRVRLIIADAYDVVLGEKTVFCGNILTDAELGAMSETDIQKELSIPQGSDVSNERIAPNGEIPFMIVFGQEQAGAVKTTVVPAGADRIP